LSGLALSAALPRILLATLSGVLLAALLSALSGLLFLLTGLLLAATLLTTTLLTTTLLTALVLILSHIFLRWFLSLRQPGNLTEVPAKSGIEV
jgi:hypothetical protein